MRRTAALFFILILCVTLSGCGKQVPYTDYTAYLEPSDSNSNQHGSSAPVMQFAGSEAPPSEEESASTEFTDVVTIVSTPAPVYTPTPEAVITPSPVPVQTQVSVRTPAPTPVPTPMPNQIRITKSPLSETVNEGGSCYFTAYADNSGGITWITVSPDARNSYDIRDAVKVFPALNVTGQGTNTLSLSNVPYEMNGWRIQAYFTGNGGPQYTAGAYLTVLPNGNYPWVTPVPTNRPMDGIESNVSELAKKAYNEVYYAISGMGFQIGSLSNYFYYNGTADFNISVTNASYQIIGEFMAYYTNSTNYGYGPAHVMVYDSYGNLRANEDLSGQSMNAFTSLVYQYR